MHGDYKLSKEVMVILQPLVEIELYQSSVYVSIANACNRLGYMKAESYFLGESNDKDRDWETKIQA